MVDVETTGMRALGNDRITEIAVVVVCGERREVMFESLVNPGRPIIGHQVHGIKTEDVASAPTAAEVLPRFVEWVGETPIVAHNVSFDLPYVLRHLPNDVGAPG